MEKSLKFTASELLDSFNREFNQDEMNEIYKALIAYGLGIEITPAANDKLDEVIDFYFDTDYISNIVNQDVMDKAEEIFFDNF